MKSKGDIGVIFDMDGVLVDSADAHLASWQGLARELGQTVTKEQFARTFGQQNRDIIPLLFGETDASRIVALADRKEELYRDLVREYPPIMAGAIVLVRGLAEAGARLAVGSSGPLANIELILDAMGVRGLMSAIVSGDDVSRGKPNPEVFLIAAERIGVPPSRCVVIEDAPVGVEAAQRAGMKCIAVMTHHPGEALANADLVIQNLTDATVDGVLCLMSGTA